MPAPSRIVVGVPEFEGVQLSLPRPCAHDAAAHFAVGALFAHAADLPIRAPERVVLAAVVHAICRSCGCTCGLWKACGCNGLWPLVVESLWHVLVV